MSTANIKDAEKKYELKLKKGWLWINNKWDTW